MLSKSWQQINIWFRGLLSLQTVDRSSYTHLNHDAQWTFHTVVNQQLVVLGSLLPRIQLQQSMTKLHLATLSKLAHTNYAVTSSLHSEYLQQHCGLELRRSLRGGTAVAAQPKTTNRVWAITSLLSWQNKMVKQHIKVFARIKPTKKMVAVSPYCYSFQLWNLWNHLRILDPVNQNNRNNNCWKESYCLRNNSIYCWQ